MANSRFNTNFRTWVLLGIMFSTLCLSIDLRGQQFDINSTVKDLSQSDIDSLNDVREKLYKQQKYPQLLLIYHQLQNYYQSVGDTAELVRIKIALADINRAAQNLEYAKGLLNEILQTTNWNDKEVRAKVYSIRAATNYELHELDDAISDAKTAIGLANETGLDHLIASCYNILGAAYRELDLDSSIYYLQLAVEQHLLNKDSADLALVYFNISNAYLETQPILAEEYALRSFKLSSKHGVSSYQMMALNNIIATNLDKDKLREALKYIGIRDSISAEISFDKLSIKVNQIMELIEEEQEAKNYQIIKENLELNQKISARKDLLLYLAALILILFIAISTVIFKNNLRDRRYLSRMKKLNEEVSEYSSKLAELNHTKDKILSVISHDMRSPFSQFITYLSFEEEGDISPEDRAMINAELLSTSKNGLHMLDNLLYWAGSQKDGRKVIQTNFVVAETLKDVKEYLGFIASRKKTRIKVKCDLKLQLNADKVLYEIVVRNLVSNAIKYAPANSDVNVEVEVSNEMVHTHIIDQGVGIPVEVKEAFHSNKLDYKSLIGTNGEKGAGMGLYLCAEFAKLNKGTIEFLPVNIGTHVKFSVPHET